MATQMACEPKAMAQEGIAADLFGNRKAPFVLNLNDPDAPTLTVVSAHLRCSHSNGSLRVFDLHFVVVVQTQPNLLLFEYQMIGKQPVRVGKGQSLNILISWVTSS
jgi:hypothetical protein